MFHRPCRRTLIAASVSFLLIGCTATSGHQPASKTPPPPFEVGQILSVATSRAVAFEPWLDELASTDVIYLGEEHHNRSHVESALTVLRALNARGRRPILALEMFAWDSQPALDRYVADQEFSTEEFLKDSRWEQSWGGPFAGYAPLVAFAREQQLSLLALNPPRALVRQVAQQGPAKALSDPEMARWGMQTESFVDDQAYRDKIVGQLRRCHGGLSDDAYQRMYEASLFRDEGMARTIAAALQSDLARRPIVSYTGGGHIQYRVPVPNRVQRRSESAKQVTVYLAAYEPSMADEIRTAMHDRIADYIWLTPLSALGPPRRCK